MTGSSSKITGMIRPGRRALAPGALNSDFDELLKSLKGEVFDAGWLRKAEQCGFSLQRLVLDGIAEQYVEGRWVSGPKAHHLISEYLEGWRSDDSHASCSVAAIRFGDAQRGLGLPRLARAVHLFETLPLKTRSTDGSAQETVAQETVAGAIERSVRSHMSSERKWERHLANGYWLYRQKETPGPLAFTLYLSPHPASVLHVLPMVLSELAASQALRFRIGAGLLGLQRPDKIVAEFVDFASLSRFASLLAPCHAVCRVHGVPFTAPLDDSGLLSWAPGIAELAAQGLPHLRAKDDWRLWIARQVACSLLISGQFDASPEEAVDFCLARLEAAGVDTRRWLPRGLQCAIK